MSKLFGSKKERMLAAKHNTASKPVVEEIKIFEPMKVGEPMAEGKVDTKKVVEKFLLEFQETMTEQLGEPVNLTIVSAFSEMYYKILSELKGKP